MFECLKSSRVLVVALSVNLSSGLDSQNHQEMWLPVGCQLCVPSAAAHLRRKLADV